MFIKTGGSEIPGETLYLQYLALLVSCYMELILVQVVTMV